MKYIISRYNHDVSWISRYTNNYILYDRSDTPLLESIPVSNVGSDIYDKFTYIIDNYDHLPEIAIYTKANIFKYITEEEFEMIKNNKKFTPILTKNHEEKPGISFYSADGLYNEINNYWYLSAHPINCDFRELTQLLGIAHREFVRFAPGSNYILPKNNILKHSREFYIKLRSFLEWTVYPGESQIMERGLFYLWS